MVPDHEAFIRQALRLAQSAVEHGNHPFGALLAKDGEVLLTAENTVRTSGDPTGHAEMNLVRAAALQLEPEVLSQSVLYTSTEPCAMCSGGIYWVGIPAVVYACSAEALARITGPSLLFPCRELFARGARPTQVIGPILEEEGVRLHQTFW